MITRVISELYYKRKLKNTGQENLRTILIQAIMAVTMRSLGKHNYVYSTTNKDVLVIHE